MGKMLDMSNRTMVNRSVAVTHVIGLYNPLNLMEKLAATGMHKGSPIDLIDKSLVGMGKKAYNFDKNLDKLQDDLNDYDSYRSTYGSYANVLDMFNDYKMQRKSSDVIARVEGLRRYIADQSGDAKPKYTERLARILNASQFYGTDHAIMAAQRADRRNRMFGLSLVQSRQTIPIYAPGVH